jgi:hypothetical protein
MKSLLQQKTILNPIHTYRARAMGPAQRARYHGTTAGYQRLIRTILFGTATNSHAVGRRRPASIFIS